MSPLLICKSYAGTRDARSADGVWVPCLFGSRRHYSHHCQLAARPCTRPYHWVGGSGGCVPRYLHEHVRRRPLGIPGRFERVSLPRPLHGQHDSARGSHSPDPCSTNHDGLPIPQCARPRVAMCVSRNPNTSRLRLPAMLEQGVHPTLRLPHVFTHARAFDASGPLVSPPVSASHLDRGANCC